MRHPSQQSRKLIPLLAASLLLGASGLALLQHNQAGATGADNVPLYRNYPSPPSGAVLANVSPPFTGGDTHRLYRHSQSGQWETAGL